MMEDPTSISNNNNNNSSSSSAHGASSILVEKVQRALTIRTDTPAMVAALEALARLPDADEIDSRSVRVAIERDALQQAIQLQIELQSLVDAVSSLRQGVSHISHIAHDISTAIHTNVVTTTTATTTTTLTLPSTNTANSNEEDENEEEDDALEKEVALATELANAFREHAEAKQRAEMLEAFLEKFDLSPQQSELLDTYEFDNIDVDGIQFLNALERVRIIRRELSTLDSSSSSVHHHHHSHQSTEQQQQHQDRFIMGTTSAIRMMESLSQKQERAYERLYHWLQHYLHLFPTQHQQDYSTTNTTTTTTSTTLDPDAMDEALSHVFVQKALKTLQHVPAFYSHMLELIATSRRVEVTRRFLLALTSGWDGNAPIEVKAHDPVNYVGDMLAFCFQAASVEADNVKHIILHNSNNNDDDNDDDEVDEGKDDTAIDETTSNNMTGSDMLSHAMSGIARPLKSRILQVIASLARKDGGEGGVDDNSHQDVEDEQEGAVARLHICCLYEICGLLLFYHSALLKTCHQETSNPLVVAVLECLKEATEAYAASLRVYAAMLDSFSILSGETEASLAQVLMNQLVDVRMTSPGFAFHVACPPELQPSLSLEFMTTTLLEAALSSCKSLDDAVTLKACLVTAKKSGLVTATTDLESKIYQEETNMIDGLVEEKTAQVLDLCGLGTMAMAWKNLPPIEGMTMASQSGLTPDECELSMKEFYSSLYAPPLPTFEGIKDPVLRRMARSKIADNVVSTYAELYHAMHSEKGGYDDLSFLGHSPKQVKTLFSV